PDAVVIKGGTISGNQAQYGGGAYITKDSFMDMQAGTISDNTADDNGGGIFTEDYDNLTVGPDAEFSLNKAAAFSLDRDPAQDAVYAANILSDKWSTPFTQGYNNYDINHGFVLYYLVTFMWNDGTGDEYDSVNVLKASPAATIGDANMPSDPLRTEYDFTEWNTEPDNSGTQFTSATPVEGNILVYAQWEAKPQYAVTVDGSYASDTGAGNYYENAVVTINAGIRSGYTFVNWTTSDGVVFTDASSATTTFTMPAQNVAVTANWLLIPVPYTVKVDESYASDTGAGVYYENDTVTIDAGIRSGYTFINWTTYDGVVFTDASSATTTFTMPAQNVTVTANWTAIPREFKVTVNGSYASNTGAGNYYENATVTINAGTRSGYSFINWTTSDGVVFANATSATTTFTMPAQNVTVTANWKYLEGGTPSTGDSNLLLWTVLLVLADLGMISFLLRYKKARRRPQHAYR
ncbi:MAG: InlB B-repeat-containing protein, partial [Coriobacteriales bacterium]|nr:InlB B-repeat-containing protein [Coriobacteriales bacterium]